MERNLIILLFVLSSVLSAQAQQPPDIVSFEYWFDQNHEARAYVPVTPAPMIDLVDQQLNTAGLSQGQHLVHFRWKDQPSAGQACWSSVVTRALHVGQPGPWEITAIRYWWSSFANPAPGTDMRYLNFETPQTVLTYDELLELCGYPSGPHVLKLQLRDNHGQWSSVVTQLVNITDTPNMAITSITASEPQLCIGDTVTFTAQAVIAPDHALPTSYTWSFPSDWEPQASDSGSIEVILGSSLGEISVTGTNYCEQTTSASLMVTNVNCTVGLPESTARPDGPLVFPNPSNGIFQISMSEGQDPPELIVLDLLGRRLIPQIGSSADGQLVLDLRNEAPGTYMLQIRVQHAWTVVPITLVR